MHSFERSYGKLKSVERTLVAGTSKEILGCMRLQVQGGAELLKHNFYTNKFDATAWNDFDAVPRASSHFGLEDHGGSRKRLLFSRRQKVTEDNQRLLDVADARRPMMNTRRQNLITNVEMENGR